MAEHGSVLAVTEELVGDYLATPDEVIDWDDLTVIWDDLAEGWSVTALYLEDVWKFDPDGGQIQLDDGEKTEIATYIGIDYDTSSLILTAPLTEGFDVGTAVHVYPLATATYAVVQLDYVDDGPIQARVPYSMKAQLPTGMRDPVAGESESVTVEVQRDEWAVLDLLGAQPILDGSTIDPDTVPFTDGDPPGGSPTPSIVQGGPGFLVVKWDGVANSDTTTYEVHISESSGFTPDNTPVTGTIVAEVTEGNLVFIRNLCDGTPLEYWQTPPTETEDGVPKVYYVKLVAYDADGTATPGGQVAGSLAQVTTDDIVANAITANEILAGEITAEKLAGVIANFGTLIAGDPDGQHVELSADNGVRLYAADGETVLVDLPIDAISGPSFSGTVNADALEVSGGATLRGTTSTLEPLAALTIQSAPGDPSTPPSATQGFSVTMPYADNFNHYGLFYDPNGDVGGTTDTLWTTRPTTSGGYYRLAAEYDAATGEQLRSIDVGSGNDCWGVCRVGDVIWVFWSPNDDDIWYLSSYDQETLVKLNQTSVGTHVANNTPGLMTDGTYLYIISTKDFGISNTRIQLSRFLPFGSPYWLASYVDFKNLDATFLVDGHGVAANAATEFGGGVSLTESYINGGNPVFWITMYSYKNAAHYVRGVYAFDIDPADFSGSTGDWTGDSFTGSAGAEADGIAHDGTVFWSTLWNNPAVKHSNWWWAGTAAADSTYWCSYAWADTIGTAHETQISPRRSITMRKRRELFLSTPPIPGEGGTDEADSVNYYLVTGATDPSLAGPGYSHLQANGTASKILATYNSSGAADGGGTAFPAGTPATLKTQDGKFSISGDDVFKFPYFGARGTMSTYQSVGSGNTDAIGFDGTDTWDTGLIHDPGTNPSRFTIPTGYGGYWRVVAVIDYDAAGSAQSRLDLSIVIDGTTTKLLRRWIMTQATGGGSAGVEGIIDIAAGSYFELYANPIDEAVQIGSSSITRCFLEATYVGQ